MNYQQTLDYLYQHLPMFSRIGAAAIKPHLHNTIELCNILGNPQQQFPCIHVAGTNGKGSTSHMLAAILQTAGYKTALYTSPHLKDFRERIKVNGEMIAEEDVIQFVEQIKPAINTLQPSFFEITVAMAFHHFAKEEVDIAVIETGLGGRLDSTNIITPVLSVITNIGWDHMNILGDTLEKIAAEKAGIIKKNIPVVVGEYLPETRKVFEEKAILENAPLFFAADIYRTIDWHFEHHRLKAEVVKMHTNQVQFFELDLPGIYQTKNLVTVLEAVHQLQQQGFAIDHSQLHRALQQVKKLTGLHGRWELTGMHPQVILDVAHNEDGMKQVLQQLELSDYHQLHWILGMVKDKDVDKVLSLLPKTANYYFTQAQIPRALPHHELKEKAARFELSGNSYPQVNLALKAALAKAHGNDLVLVCGSVFVVGEVER